MIRTISVIATGLLRKLFKQKTQDLFKIALLIRIVLLIYSYVHELFGTDFKYTDIDYTIFTDGARHLVKGESPFKRDTYRYTPLLALFMIPNVWFHPFGKLLFIGLDLANGALIHELIAYSTDRKFYVVFFLFNPSTMIISTRGSAESVICFLVLSTLYFFKKGNIFLSALIYGLAIHFKIYPLIFAPTFYFYLTKDSDKKDIFKPLYPNIQKLIFAFTSISSLLISSYISFHFCGKKYINEAWLYHFYRQDLQHNFSPAFYFFNHIPRSHHQLISLLYFLPQSVFITIVAYFLCIPWKRSRTTPANPFFMALFVQAFIFVTWNKVITAQYFEWYICLLPLVASGIRLTINGWFKTFLLWSFAIVQWIIPAYLWEFQSLPVYHWLGIASVLFSIIHTWIIINLYGNFK